MATAEAIQQGAPQSRARPGDPCVVGIFGAAGDLTKRKLIPSLYNLLRSKLLAGKFAVIGVTAAKFTDETTRSSAPGVTGG